VSQFTGTSDRQLLSESFLYTEGRDYEAPLLVTVGALVKSSVDLFSIAYENNKSNFVYRSWAALANGGQIGKPRELVDGGVPFLENESPALIANADLNGDGVAEIILASYFSATSGNPSSGRIRIGNISEIAAGLKWTDLSEIPLEAPNLIPTLKGLLSANDLNGDGLADIVLATGNGALTIFWNNGNSQFDKPTFMAQEGVFAFALTHDQPDGPKTLVYTAGKSIVSSSFSKERTIIEAHNIIDGLVAPTGITTGDYNGDGIEDIAVVDNQNLLMLRGNARKPGQTLK
jgi:hypothetical protein